MTQCCVYGCSVNGGFVFPRDKRLRKIWLQRVSRQGFHPTKHSVVCRKHFVDDDFSEYTYYGARQQQKRLKKGAIPSVALGKPSSSTASATPRQARYKKKDNEQLLDSLVSLRLQELDAALDQQVQEWAQEAEEMQRNAPPAPEVSAYEELNSEEACYTADHEPADDVDISCSNSGVGDEACEPGNTGGATAMDDPGVSCSNKDKSSQCDMRVGFVDATTSEGLAKVPTMTGMDADTFQLLLAILHPEYRRQFGQKKFATRGLGFENSVLLTVTKLRHNLTNAFLAMLFDVSVSTVNETFKRTASLMSVVFRQVNIWPAQYDEAKPVVIVDCTEVKVSRPSNPTLQSQTYSTYKSSNTVKFLIGITPAGGLSFVSDGYSGSTSDQKVFAISGIMDKLKRGDIVLADRGFNIQDLLACRDVRVITPAFLRGKSQLSPAERAQSRAITRDRIHVERMIGLIKTFSFLTGQIDAAYVPALSDIFRAVCLVCGLQKSLM